MREAFEGAGVWALGRRDIALANYGSKGDPLKIDFGYRPNGVIKMFQAVSLETDVDAAKVLAFSYPALREGLRRAENAASELTAVVEDGLSRDDDGDRICAGDAGGERDSGGGGERDAGVCGAGEGGDGGVRAVDSG